MVAAGIAGQQWWLFQDFGGDVKHNWANNVFCCAHAHCCDRHQPSCEADTLNKCSGTSLLSTMHNVNVCTWRVHACLCVQICTVPWEATANFHVDILLMVPCSGTVRTTTWQVWRDVTEFQSDNFGLCMFWICTADFWGVQLSYLIWIFYMG